MHWRWTILWLVAVWSMEAGPRISSDSDDFSNEQLNPADTSPTSEEEPAVLLDKVPNFKFDPSQFEVISDEDEDKPLQFDVHCDKFLSAPAEHIAPLFPDIPLHDEENFRELTEEAPCRAQFVPKCNLITAQQIGKIWETQKREGLEKLHYIGCLQRITDFSTLTGPEALEVIKTFPVSEWLNWWAFPPNTLLEILTHHRFSDRLMPVTKPAQLTNFLAHEGWRGHREAWQLFDRPFISIIGQGNKETELMMDLLEFKRRFPTLSSGKYSSKEAQMVPRWAVRLYVAIEEMSRLKSPTTGSAAAHLVTELTEAARIIDTINCKSGKHETKCKSALLLAKSAILVAPKIFFEACDPQLSEKTRFKLAKQLKIEIEGGQLGQRVLERLRALKAVHDEQVDNLLSRKQLAKLFGKAALRNVKDPLRSDFHRDFVLLTIRPDMSEYELDQLKQFIIDDLKDVAFPDSDTSSSSDDSNSGQQRKTRKVPEKVRGWLQATWLAGSQEGYVFVCELLNRTWNSSRTTEELIVDLAMKDPDFVEAGLVFLKDARTAFRLVARPESQYDAQLELENVPWEGIWELPLRDLRFFGPSFSFLTDAHRLDIHHHWLEIHYLNEQAFDGGGPRRNWISKMLLAWQDPKRHFLRTHEQYVIPELFVHAEVFLGLGRLIGKGLVHDAGLPFAFHPQFSLLLQHPDDKDQLRKIFDKWYQSELEMIEAIRQMALNADSEAEGLEEVEMLGVLARKYWKLAEQTCGATVALPVADVIERGCPVPGIKCANEMFLTDMIVVGRKQSASGEEEEELKDLAQFMTETGMDRDKAILAMADLAEPFTFKPQSRQEVEKFVEEALESAWVHFVDCIDSFLTGLGLFMDVAMMKHMRIDVLRQIFTPVLNIDLDALLGAFNYLQEHGRTVAVVNPDKIPPRCHAFLIAPQGNDQPHRMTLSNAFACAVIQLTPEELNGLVGQLTGSRSTGFGRFKANHFKVLFSEKTVKNPLIPSQFCPAVPGNSSSKRFPFTAACSKSISMPAYATLEEVVMAVHIIATAPDEFPLR